jgi:ABC-type nitrate/sulfonate/bicarbonate transport system substrate-binding protein
VKIAVPDLISNSYFPVCAAVELGCFRDEGVDLELEMIFPVDRAYRALQAGEIAFVGGSAHSALAAFPNWQGGKLLAAQAQGMYWFLVMRADLGPRRGDLDIVKGRRIGAAPWVEMGLRRLLAEGGIDIDRDGVQIAPVPGTGDGSVNFGVTAAKALEAGVIDGFWANGMGTEVSVRSGVGRVVLDVRRGEGPAGAFDYTFASLATSDAFIARSPDLAAAAVRGLVKAQRLLAADPGLATQVGAKLLPAREAELIRTLVERDLPYYQPAISPRSVAAMNRFARDLGILDGDPGYEAIVATQFSAAWDGVAP